MKKFRFVAPLMIVALALLAVAAVPLPLQAATTIDNAAFTTPAADGSIETPEVVNFGSSEAANVTVAELSTTADVLAATQQQDSSFAFIDTMAIDVKQIAGMGDNFDFSRSITGAGHIDAKFADVDDRLASFRGGTAAVQTAR